MTVNLSALAGAGQQFFDNNGNPLSGGKLWSYQAGTTTPQTTYTTAAGTPGTEHTNPIILDSAGRVPTGEIWLTAGSNYKFVLMTSTNVPLATWDNISGINGTGITSNAVNVEYDPPFTGALTSGYTVQDKLAQTVSVKDFGAVGDGVTDDTAAIQAAVDSGALEVYFPNVCRITTVNITLPIRLYGPGGLKKTTVRSDALLNVTTSNVEIDGLQFIGAGAGSVIATTNTADNAIRANGINTPTQLSNITIKNCVIDGLAGFGIRIDYATNVLVENNLVQYCGYAGIMGLSVIHAVITKNRVNRIQSNAGAVNWYGISITRDPTKPLSDSARSADCVISENVVSNVLDWTGIDMHAPYKAIVTENQVYGCKNGIYAQYDSSSGTYKQPAEDVIISDNVVEGPSDSTKSALGIASLGLPALPNKNITIQGNHVIGCGGWATQAGALHVTSTKVALVENNFCYKSIRGGLSLTGISDQVVFRNNFVDGVAPSAATAFYYAYVDYSSGLTACLFDSNRFFTTDVTGYTPTSGIYYVTGGDGVVYSKNRLFNLGSSAFLQEDGGSANAYTDLRWELEEETVSFNYTTTGGVQFESTGDKISLFRRTPTGIYLVRVTFNQPNVGSFAYQVRGSYGNVTTAAVYRYDGTNVSAGVILTDIVMSVRAIYWRD